jgi:hypothetical protein
MCDTSRCFPFPYPYPYYYDYPYSPLTDDDYFNRSIDVNNPQQPVPPNMPHPNMPHPNMPPPNMPHLGTHIHIHNPSK